MTSIMLIDDEPEIVRFVRRGLEAEGYQVSQATDGANGLLRALTEPTDLLILDLLMPGVDGRTVLGALLAHDPTRRILVLSAAADVQTRLGCLESGAVDFLAKPFSMRELLVRVRLRLAEPVHDSDQLTLRVGNLLLDLGRQQLLVSGRECDLSHREFLLLQHLMRKANAVCSRQELLSDVWGYEFDPGTNIVDVYVRRLRVKLANDSIRTVRNVGYQLRSA
jgi:DNA-binding response OmpR family regulator